MSPYERRPRSNDLGGDELRLPKEENRPWAKGLWALGGSIDSAVAGHSTGNEPTYEVERGCGQTMGDEGHANQRLSLAQFGKTRGGKAKVSNRTWEIRPSGIIGGPRET